MFNVFIFKKWTALILASCLSTITFAVVATFYGFMWAIVGFLVSMILGVVIGNLLLDNPFRSILEGKGILFFDLNSTGIIKISILGVRAPFVTGKIDGKQIKDCFDRNAVVQVAEPKEEKDAVTTENGVMTIRIKEEDYAKSKFALYHYPALIWNDQIKSFITKDFLSEKEKETFSEHTVIYLNRIMEELTSLIRDFARYVVETLKPKESFTKGWLFWVIIIGALILLGALFLPKVIEAIQGGAGEAVSQTVRTVGSGSAITPR